MACTAALDEDMDISDLDTVSLFGDSSDEFLPEETGSETGSSDDRVTSVSGTKKKPAMIIAYTQSKSFIDLSDQMNSYSHCLRRGVKWYRKLAIELMTGLALINDQVIYQYINYKNISITEFKEEVPLRLLHTEDADEPETSLTKATALPADCALVNMGAARRCTVCYKQMKNELEREQAVKKCKQTA